jgi:Tol biopolymer transport system component
VSLTSGTRLGPYEVLAPLGAGGMGEVYRSRDTRLGRVVAIKVLHSAAAADPDRRLRFEHEARAIASLNHPHICTLHDFGSHGDVDFLVMEYLEGETLAQRLARGALPLDRALRHAVEIAAALAAAHGAGVVHRDLKPSNIMLTESGAKLLDFGLAKLQQPDPVADPGLATVSPRVETLTGVIVGTLPYMAPEQVKGAAADARSDIFSFGAVVYEMATGRRAFQAEGQRNLIGAILDADPPPIATVQPLAPPALDRIVHKCLAKDPGQRWHTTHDLFDALRWLTEPEVAPATRRTTVSARVVFASLAAVAAAGLAAWLWFGPLDRAPQLTGQRLVTDYRGSHGWPTFSPDGKMMAYTSSADGSDQLWVKNLAAGDPIQLTFGPPGAGRVTWSPSGDQIVFGRPGQGIWSIPPLGGAPRQLLEQGHRPKFSRDGRRLVYERGGEIWIANADGREARRVYEPPPSFQPSLPALSPDGESIAFFLARGGGPLGDYWILPVDGGPARQVTFDASTGGGAAWTPDGRSLVFPSARRGSLTLWHIAAEGGTPRPLTFGAGADVDPEVSSDGKRLIYANLRDASGLMLTDPATARGTELLQRQSDIFGGAFSPAGDQVAFFYQVETGVHVFTVRTDGRDLRQITHAAGEVNTFPHWSGDGASLYFFRDKPRVSLLKVPATGGPATEIGPWPQSTRARVDPSDTRVVLERGDGDVTHATIVRHLATGQETTLSRILRFPRWTRDGRTIIGTEESAGADGLVHQRIVACTVGGPCHDVADGARGVPSGDGSRAFFLRPSARGSPFRELWSVDRDGRNARQWEPLGPFRVGAIHFDVSVRDQILWSIVQSGENRIWLSEFR